MKSFLGFIILAALLQTAFIPLNLCLILIIARSFIVKDRSNYLLSFIGGIFLSILSGSVIGFWSIVFLMVVKLIQIIKSLPILSNFQTALPISILILTVISFLEQQLFNQTINFYKILWESLTLLLLYFLVKFWEERFVVRSEIKLKIRS